MTQTATLRERTRAGWVLDLGGAGVLFPGIDTAAGGAGTTREPVDAV